MSSRALYRLGQLGLYSTWLIYAAIFMASLRISDNESWFLHLFALGLGVWAGWKMNSALDALRIEANRDTILGRNGPTFGPVTKGDLL